MRKKKISKKNRELMAKYPLKVLAPKMQGRYLMLEWNNRDVGQSFILATSEEKLTRAFEVLLSRSVGPFTREIIVGGLREIDIVSLVDEKIRLGVAKQQYRDDLKNFEYFFADVCKMLQPDLIPGVKVCTAYEGPTDAQWAVDSHYQCTNCRVRGFDFNSKELFAKYGDAPRLEELETMPGSPIPAPSVAPPAQKDKDLFGVLSHGGLDRIQRIDHIEPFFADDHLFYFHIIQDNMPIPAGIQTALIERDNAYELALKRDREEAAQAELEREQAYIKKLRAYFKLPDLEMLIFDQENLTLPFLGE